MRTILCSSGVRGSRDTKPTGAASPTQHSEQRDIIQGRKSSLADGKGEGADMHGGREEEERMLLSMVLHNAFNHTCMDAKQEFCRHVRQANNSCLVHGGLFTVNLSLTLAIRT